jgi:hypothetical protein
MPTIQREKGKTGRWPQRVAAMLAGVGLVLPLTIASTLATQAIAPAAWAQAAPMTLNLPTDL